MELKSLLKSITDIYIESQLRAFIIYGLNEMMSQDKEAKRVASKREK